MKIIVVGGTGTIGKAIVTQLKKEHEVISIGHSKGDYTVDITDKDAIEKMFKDISNIDGLISTSGLAMFAPFEQLTDENIDLTINHQLTAQINLVRLGMKYLNPNGFITLTSGSVVHTPMVGAVAISAAKGGLESFVRNAALEMPNGIRINIVSPYLVKETMEMMGMDSTHGISGEDTAKVYESTAHSTSSGQVIDVLQYFNKSQNVDTTSEGLQQALADL